MGRRSKTTVAGLNKIGSFLNWLTECAIANGCHIILEDKYTLTHCITDWPQRSSKLGSTVFPFFICRPIKLFCSFGQCRYSEKETIALNCRQFGVSSSSNAQAHHCSVAQEHWRTSSRVAVSMVMSCLAMPMNKHKRKGDHTWAKCVVNWTITSS